MVIYTPTLTNGLGVAGMVLGILSVLLGVVIILPVVGLSLSIAGMVSARRQATTSGQAIAGLVLNSVALLGWGIFVLNWFTLWLF